MGKAKTTSKADPWIPSQGEFRDFQGFAGDTITNRFRRGLNDAGDTLEGLQGRDQYAPGFADTMQRFQDPNANAAALQGIKSNVIADIMPAINSSFAGSGMTGGSLHQQNLTKGLSSGLADVENQFYQQGADRSINAANSMNQAFGDSFGRDLALSQAQAGLGGMFQDAKSSALNSLLGAATGNATQTQSQSPGLAGILGGGLQIASLFSDIRLKENIKEVGQMHDGTPIYTYTYKNDPSTTHMGVMAQEVGHIEGAVSVHETGFKQVNYGVL